MASSHRRSTDSREVPSHPAASWLAIPRARARTTWAMSVSSPVNVPASMHRRTRAVMNWRVLSPADRSAGPGSKSAKGRENNQLAERGMVHDEGAQCLDDLGQVVPRVAGCAQLVEPLCELAEGLEEHLPHQARPVAEQLVDGGGGGAGGLRDPAGGEPGDAVGCQGVHGGLQHLLAQLRRPLLGPGHGGPAGSGGAGWRRAPPRPPPSQPRPAPAWRAAWWPRARAGPAARAGQPPRRPRPPGP